MEHIEELLNQVAAGTLTPQDCLTALKCDPVRNLGDVRLDGHRRLRTGFAEIVYGASKSDEQLKKIAKALVGSQEPMLFSRLDSRQAEVIRSLLPDFDYSPAARLGGINKPAPSHDGVVVLAAGSSDLPVAEEAALTAEYMGCRVTRLYDVGVAGIHRLLEQMPLLTQARAIVAVAGMEGALASVVTGLVSCPVFGVPTSVGYGASFGGLSALLAMLNSCATGLSVLNIDNGLGGGYCAAQVVRGAAR